MSGIKEWELVIIPDEERITLDIASAYESCNAVTDRMSMITSTFQTFLEPELLLVDLGKIDDSIKSKLNPDEVIKASDGRSFIRLSNTRDIARCEVNMKKSPFSSLRILYEDIDTHKKYAEIVSINSLRKSAFTYMSNLDY